MGIGLFIHLMSFFYVFIMCFINPLIDQGLPEKHALVTQATTTNSTVFKSEEAVEETKIWETRIM